jgi:hypothetical protein
MNESLIEVHRGDSVIEVLQQPQTDLVEIITPGPQGPKGEAGLYNFIDSIFQDVSDPPNVSLVNDEPSPGVLMLYGTDNSGTRGWFAQPTTGPSGSHLLSGGGVAWTGTGYNYIISAATYLINGVFHSSSQTPVTLAPSDPTLDRIDVFYVDADGLAGVITGTPGNPPVAPSVDPSTQLELTFAYVAAGSIVPSLTNENIYLENTEYTMSTNAGSINLASTNNPYQGTKDIEGTATATGDLFTGVKPSGSIDITAYGSLVFYIRSKGVWSTNRSLSVFWMSGATVIGSAITLRNGAFGFDSSNTTSYQQIVIPISAFNTAGTLVDRLRFSVAGSGATIGWYIDTIRLQTSAGGVTGTIVSNFTFGMKKNSGVPTGKIAGYWTCPFAGHITAWNITVDTGTITVKIWKRATGTAHPTSADSINTSGISITTGTSVHSVNLADFINTNINVGDIFACEVTAASGVTDFGGSIEITRS